MRLKNLGRFYVLGMRAPKTVLLLCFIFAVIAVLAAGRLRVGDFFAEMLPEGTESVRNLERFKRDFGELGHLVIVVDAPDPLLARQYGSDFAERIRALADVYYVRFRQPLEYFRERKWLFVDLSDLAEMERRIDRTLSLEEHGVSPVFSGLMDFADPENRPDLTFSDIQKKYEDTLGSHLDEYTMSADGRTLVLSVKARRAFASLQEKQRFIDAIQAIERDLSPSYQGVTVGYTGSYQTAVEAVDHTKREILLISVIVFPVLFLILLVYFKRVDALIFLGLPLLAAVIYTGGITYLMFGRLNLLTSFASGILAGLGSDYGIYLLSRYYQEREMGRDCHSALHFAFHNTGTATFLSLLTSVIAFSGLLFSGFSVLAEFGAVGAIGLIMNYIALMLMIPSLIILEERWQIRAWFRIFNRWNDLGQSHVFSHARWLSRLYTTRYPRTIVTMVALIACLAALTLPSQSKIAFESEGMNRLDIPGNRLYDRVSAMIGASLNPTVLMTGSLAEDRRAVDTVTTLLETAAPGELVFNRVIGLSSLIPLDQDQKKTIIQRIKDKYDQLRVAKGQQARSFIDDLQTTLAAEPIRLETVPEDVKRLFISPNSEEKFAAYLFPAFPRTGSEAMKRYQEGIMQLRQDHQLQFLPVDGSFLAADALRAMETKAPRGILFIFVFFAAILWVVLRPWDRAAMILLNLVGGMILLSGILWLCGIPFTILNIVAIPIILGTGIDCFLHFNGQYAEDHTVGAAMKKQVNPILMSSLTSMIGFGALVLTSNPSLRSLGWVAVIGLALMAVLAIFVFSRCLVWESLKKNSKAIVLVLGVCVSTHAVAVTSPNVPIDDRAYRQVDQLIAYDLMPTAIYGQRPWSRNEIARLVATARKKYEARCGSDTAPAFCAAAEPILRDLEKTFHDELVDRGDAPGEKKSYRLYLAHEIVVDYTGLSSPWRQVPVSNGLGAIDAQVNPLVSYRGGRHVADGHSLGLETRNRAKLSDYVALALEPRLELLIPEDDDVDASALVQQGYVKLGVHNVELTVGRDALIWGHGAYGGVLASSNARPLDLVKLANDEPFQYPSILKYLGYHKYSFFVAHLGPEYTFKNAFVYGVAASWKPLSLLELGFKHQITTAGEGAPDTEFLDLVSEFFFYRRNGGRYGSSNVADHRFGLDLRLAIPPLRGTVLYAEGVFEDYGRESFLLQFTQQMGFQAGIYAPLVTADGRHDLRLQYEHIPGAYGRHSTWTSGLSLNRLLRGSATGPQGQSVTLDWNYAIRDPYRVETRIGYLNSGNDVFTTLSSSTGGPDEVVKAQDNPAEHRLLATSGLVWELGKGLSLRPTIGYERVYNFNFVQDDDRHHVMGQIELGVRRR